MTHFLTSPEANSYSLSRIGGAKAVESGFLLLGSGAGEILEYIPAPIEVATRWRDELAGLLSSFRPHRPLRQIDWVGVAAAVDVAWATEWAAANGWAAPAASQTAE